MLRYQHRKEGRDIWKIKAWIIVLGALILADQIQSRKQFQNQTELTAQAIEIQAKINQKLIDALKILGRLDKESITHGLMK